MPYFSESLWALYLALDMMFILLLFRIFGKAGLYMSITMNIILCNMTVPKLTELFGFQVTMGTILYASILFTTDILSEVYGKKEAQKGVNVGLFALVISAIFIQITLMFPSAESDIYGVHLDQAFDLFWRIALASLVAYMISQYHDIMMFHYIGQKTSGKLLWLRNNISTLVSQALDTLFFTVIAFYGVFELDVLAEIFITTYILKVIIALVDTPFLYLAVHLAPETHVVRIWKNKVPPERQLSHTPRETEIDHDDLGKREEQTSR